MTCAPSREVCLRHSGTISTSITNWLTNLSFGKKSFPSACQGCQTHGGFLDSYLALQGQVRRPPTLPPPSSQL